MMPFSANRYIADFSKLIRSILYNFNSDFVSLEKEIESVEDYLKIEHLRFGDKFNYRVIMDSGYSLGSDQGLPRPYSAICRKCNLARCKGAFRQKRKYRGNVLLG